MRHLAAIGAISLFGSNIYAGGFKLEFQSASTLADAGDAAVVEDAGTNWYNSAGLVYIPRQFVGTLFDIYQSSRFSGSTFAAAPVPALNFSATGKTSSNTNSILPTFHIAYPINDCFALGLTATPAWGLTQDYGEGTILRYNLTRIYTRTIDIAPSLAYKFNDHWSVGFGPDFHYFYMVSKSRSRTQPLTTGDSVSKFSGDSWNYGAHIGVLFRIDDRTRIGVNYRTKIVQNVEGFSDFQLGPNPEGTVFESGDFRLPVNLPATTSLSFYRDVNPCFAIMGTIAYDQWSVLQNLHARNVITPTGLLPDVNIPQHYSNTVDVGVGTKVKVNENFLLRGSIKYVGSPTKDEFREIFFPDSEKLGLNVGGHYQMSKEFGVDLVLAHVWALTVPVNAVNPVSGATATGRVRGFINLAGAQFVWNM